MQIDDGQCHESEILLVLYLYTESSRKVNVTIARVKVTAVKLMAKLIKYNTLEKRYTYRSLCI